MRHKTFILAIPSEKDSIQYEWPVIAGSAHPSKLKDGYTDFYFTLASARIKCLLICQKKGIPFLTKDDFLEE